MIRIKHITLLLFCICLSSSTFSQYDALGLKGGLTLGMQNWNGQQREPLFASNVSFVYEKFNSETFSLLLDVGYHVKGSAIRTSFYDLQGNFYRVARKNKFHNASIMAGAKSVLNTGFIGGDLYYLFGVRLEYTMGDSVETAANFSRFVQPINYGITAGGGIQFELSEKIQMFFELQISPDFSQQLYVPPGNYFATYGGSTYYVQLNEQKVTNLAVELTVGFKLLRY